MITNDICKALYALPAGVIVERRQPICRPVVAALLGAALMVVNFTLVDDKSGAMAMTLMLAGITMLFVGIILTIVRLSSSTRVPYHTPSKSYMRFRERYYDRELLGALQQAVAQGDKGAIDMLPTGNVSAITLIECRAKDGSIEAYAIYEYANFDNKLVGEVKLLRHR